MKILLCNRPGGAFGYITDGWAHALRDRGHEIRRWDGMESTWREFNPSVYIGCSGHKQPIPPHRDCKIAIHVNPYGPVKINGINESDENIRWTLAQKPDAVFGYGHEDDRLLWSDWKNKHKITWVPMATAGDAVFFGIITPPEDRPHDIVYLGGRWAYKGKTIDKFLLPILQNANLNCKVYGWGDWQPGVCSGILPEDQAKIFLNSGRIGPCISEIHTHQYGLDIPERAFKLALCGTLVIHDPIPSIKRMIPSALVSGQDPNNFIEMCAHFSDPKNAAERQSIVDKQRQEVLSAHTYHHRMSILFAALGFDDAAKDMIAG